MEVNGVKFNQMFGGQIFYKFFCDDQKLFKKGLNTWRTIFTPKNPKGIEGLWFAGSDFSTYIDNNTKYYSIVTVPNDPNVTVYVKDKRFKSSELILHEIKEFNDTNFPNFAEVVKKNGMALRYMFYQTDQARIDAVTQCGYALQFCTVETAKLCEIAVQQNGYALEYVTKNQYSKEEYQNICMKAVMQNGDVLQYVDPKYVTSYYDICLAAMSNYGFGLYYVCASYFSRDEYEKICETACRQNGYALEYVRCEQTQNMCLNAVRQNGLALILVKDKNEMVSKEACKQNGGALRFVTCQTPELCRVAVEKDPSAIVLCHKRVHNSDGSYSIQ